MTRWLALVGLLAASLPVHAQSRPASLTAADGTPLAGALYQPFDEPAPAVLLLHMLGRTRGDWDHAAERLRRAGFVVLALDFRWTSAEGPGDLRPLLQDARAALAYLRSLPAVRTGPIGIAGASAGANVALLVGADEPDVRSLALLSPSLDYRGLRAEPAMRRFGDRHALLIASAEDPYALRSARQLARGGAHRELLITGTPGHGTVLLARQPDLLDHLVDWFRRTLL